MVTAQADADAIAAAVASALQAAGISRREAAARSGIPLTTLQRRLTGRSPFLTTELAVLAALAGTQASAIVAAAEQQGVA